MHCYWSADGYRSVCGFWSVSCFGMFGLESSDDDWETSISASCRSNDVATGIQTWLGSEGNKSNPFLTDLLTFFEIVVHCKLYLCHINRLDIPEDDHNLWTLQSTEYNNCIYVLIVNIGSAWF